MATEAVKLVCGIGDPLVGRLMVFDALAMTWRTLNVRPNPALPPITELVDYEAFCGLTPVVTGADPVGAATIDVHALRDLLAARERGDADFVLVDVREPYEREIVVIPGAVNVPKADVLAAAASGRWPDALAGGRRVVLHCKAGGRSAEALAALLGAGRADAVHVAGGVLAWAREIDPSLPTY
jgi:adenylyltransferase/sulfurtransferase